MSASAEGFGHACFGCLAEVVGFVFALNDWRHEDFNGVGCGVDLDAVDALGSKYHLFNGGVGQDADAVVVCEHVEHGASEFEVVDDGTVTRRFWLPAGNFDGNFRLGEFAHKFIFLSQYVR